MILLEKANHAIELVDLHMAVGLEIMDDTRILRAAVVGHLRLRPT